MAFHPAALALLLLFAKWGNGDADLEFFEKSVRPILIERCYSCHSEESRRLRGGLYLDSRAGWATGGDSGPALVPGDADASRLIVAVRYEDENLEMPPRGKLPEEEIAVLVDWVRRGAPDPRLDDVPADTRREIDVEAGREFWSFRPLQEPAVPETDSDWPRNDVDRFLLSRMHAQGLQPTGDADRRTLLRRVTFDLTGLPPTPVEIDAFLADDAPDAFARVVDRLLDSPAYGERWGRHWLDVARFAESSGGGRSLMFPEAWRYRDYVIESYQRDVPFHQFVNEQIAGDLLPYESMEDRNRALVAAGFLVLGPTNYEQQDKEKLRWDVIDEQIDTVGRAFLGLTLGCARCHDHKFDPIPTADYYSLAGIFASTDVLTPGNVSGYVKRELAGPATDAWNEYQQQDAELVRGIQELRKSLGGEAGGAEVRPIDRAMLQGLVLDDSHATLIGEWKQSTYHKGFLDRGYLHDENARKGEKSVTYEPDIPAEGVYEVRLSYTPGSNRATNVPITIQSADGPVRVLVNQKGPPPLQGWFVSLGRHRFAEGMGSVITVSTEDTDGHVIVDALQLIPEHLLEATGEVPLADVARRTEVEQRIHDLEQQRKALQEQAPAQPPRAMTVQDSTEPADANIHIRGAVRNLGPVVPRGFVQVCMSAPADVPDDRSGRLELARWLTSPEHPLTARVYVNRVWHHLFGTGLVRTTDNFGAMGETPSHPELLDWLARRFLTDGGSTKQLIRLLVGTRAYQLRAVAPPEQDPENRLRSVASRRRLQAEAIRDSILSVSGQLDRTRGGLTIRKLSEYDLGYQHDTDRRSVYVPFFRNAMLELFDVFDGANANLVTGRRNVSNVAPQALYLMNSPWVIEQSGHAARRYLTEMGVGDVGGVVVEVPADEEAWAGRVAVALSPAAVHGAFELALGRTPTPDEIALVSDYLQGFDGTVEEAWAQVFHTLFACLDFRYLN